jgi:phage replication-related protein YjqB (UPF0714/DUF867 family)
MTGPPLTVGFADMLARTDVRLRPGGRVGVLALHGGLEGGTAELADALAGDTGCAALTFRQDDGDWSLHLPSTAYDPGLCPPLARFLSAVEVVVSVHGYQDRTREERVLLGGRNRRLAAVTGARIAEYAPDYRTVVRLREIPPHLRGVEPANPVNRAPGSGVQLELPPRARGVTADAAPGDPAEPDGRLVRALSAVIRTRMGDPDGPG